MHHFCTYFDHRYLPRGVALYESLELYCPQGFRLWVLCLNDLAFDTLTQLGFPHLQAIRLADFEKGDAALALAKSNRSAVEYYFTTTPSLPLYVFAQDSSVDRVTYLDADLYFFADPAEVFDEMGDHSVAIIAHRFPPERKKSEQFGIYNVGFVSFRRDEAGLACLNWWRDRCNEWCYDRLENDRFADQKYLDRWHDLFPEKVIALQHKGANLAPWNLANYRITHRDDKVYVDGQRLVFYHFHGIKPVNSIVYNFGLSMYKVRPNATLLRQIYAPYLRELHKAQRVVNAPRLLGGIRYGSAARLQGSFIRRMWWAIQEWMSCFDALARQQLFAVVCGQVI